MTEQLPKPDTEPTRTFDCPRDEVLYRMSKAGWGTKSSGHTDAYSGWYARISNSVDELTEIVTVFGDDFKEAGLESSHALLGHWVIQEAQDHSVAVHEYATIDEAKLVYNALENVYRAWGRPHE